VANTRAIPLLDAHIGAASTVWIQGRLAAVRLGRAVDASVLHEPDCRLEALPAADGEAVLVEGVWLEAVWDLVAHLSRLLVADIPALAATCGAVRLQAETGVHVIGDGGVFVEAGATVEPMTVFDTTAGPVLLRRGAQVQAFTRVIGPVYVGRDSVITADRIAGSSIGDTCRVHGELSASIFIGHANKGHDGFVGHSVLGRWVNLGAGTITSNLKNTYGTVQLWTPHGLRDSGLQFLGTLFGDHVKTGIGTRLTTGCVLGAGANVYDRMPPKAVAPFAWGGGAPYDVFAAEKFVSTATRMMGRRAVVLTPEQQAWWARVHATARADGRWPR
jgi:UDP-N-acetylglucosamine diphosphorylase/glucosamine-1-phosphate N-acetyltransferase